MVITTVEERIMEKLLEHPSNRPFISGRCGDDQAAAISSTIVEMPKVRS